MASNPVETRKKRKSGSSITSDEKSDAGTDSDPVISRPSGQKKAKLVQMLTEHTDSFLFELRQQKKHVEEDRKTAVAEMMEKMSEASKANLEKLERIVSASTQKLTQTINMKLLLQADLSQMTSSFQEKARKAIQKHFEATVLSAIGDDDENNNPETEVDFTVDFDSSNSNAEK